MLTDFAFFEPHQHARRRPTPPTGPPPHLLSSKRGFFSFNLPACQLLGIAQQSKRPLRLAMGQSQRDPTEWLLQVVEQGGFEVRALSGPASSGYRTMGFASQELRQHLVGSLPFADPEQSLTLKLDRFSCAVPEDSGEAWLLLTAPYCQPPQVAPEPVTKPSRALLMTAPPGLVGVLRGVDVPQL